MSRMLALTDIQSLYWRLDVSRTRSVSVKLTADEHEWLRRKAHWEGQTMAGLLRERLHYLISESGYLRPPDDEPQDFGLEKEMMQFVVTVQSDSS